MATSRYSPQLVEKVNSILANADLGALSRFQAAMAELWAENIPYKVVVHNGDLVVHVKNRGGLGVNAHNVHGTMKAVKQVGADPLKCSHAHAFELAPDGPARAETLAFNEHRIAAANGLLANLSGHERFCSVSTSHFSQGCKAAQNGCITCEEDLADSTGRINMIELTRKDLKLRQLIEQGWEFTILPYQVEATWPSLPDLAQSALNAEQAAYNHASELETMSSMAMVAEAQGDEVNWEVVMKHALASSPPCREYIKPITEFVKLYGGGAGHPIVRSG